MVPADAVMAGLAAVVSADAVMLDGDLRGRSQAASARLGDEGVAAFRPQTPHEDEPAGEFEQAELF